MMSSLAKGSRVLVVGGGVVGLCIAFRLRQQGMSVRLIDAARPGAGASGAAAGMMPPGLEAFGAKASHPHLAALLMEALARWRSFADELALSAGASPESLLGYQEIGSLATACDDAGRAALSSLAARAEQAGIRAKMLDEAAVRGLEAGLSSRVLCGLSFPGDALIEPPLAVAALARALTGMGVEISSGRTVASIQSHGGGLRLVFEDGASLEADAGVLAVGWPGKTGLSLAPELSALFPVKGQILTVASMAGGPSRMVRGCDVYLAPRADGRVEVGATSEKDREDLFIESGAIIALKQAAETLFPSLKSAAVLASRVGIRPGSPDHGPLLGASAASPNLYLAAGLHRNGVLLAPLVADIITAAMTSAGRADEASVWLQRFSATRFN